MKVKIIFLPALVSEEQFEELDTPPLAIYLLGGILKDKGFDVGIIDPCEFVKFQYQDNIIEKCAKYVIEKTKDDDVLAFSSNTFNWGITKEIINLIGERNPNLPIILGGLHPTIFDDYALTTTKAKFVLRGEGEISLVELLNEIQGEHHYENVPSLSWIENGVIKKTPDVKSLDKEVLEQSPLPDYTMIPIENHYNQIPVESSRGCAFCCSFCSIPHRHNWRGFDIDEVLRRVDYATNNVTTMKYKDHVLFVDDCFSINSKRAEEILDRLMEKYDTKLKFFLEVRVSNIINSSFLKHEHNKIIYGMQVGVECGYDEGLKKINKEITVKQLYAAMEDLKKKGLTKCCMLSFIIGFPWETEKEIKATLDTMQDISAKYNVLCNLNWLIFLPSTLWKEKEQYGIHIDESMYDDPLWLLSMENFQVTHPLVSLDLFDYVDRRYEIMQEMNLRVNYNRPYKRDKIFSRMQR